MKDIDLKDLLIPIVLRRAEEKRSEPLPSLFLTIPDHIPPIYWRDNNLAQLIRAFVEFAILFGREEMPIRLAASRRGRMADLEELLGRRPSYWIQLGVEVQSSANFLDAVRILPESFGYRFTEEWQAARGSVVLSYSLPMDATLQFFLFFHQNKADQKYNLMIPIVDQRI